MRAAGLFLIATSCGGALSDPPEPTIADGGRDVTVRLPDAAVDPADSTDSLPGPCPHDLPSFTPPAYVPAAVKKGSCTSEQISDYNTSCLGATATSATCSAFQATHAACSTCLQTPDTASSWGPLVWHPVLHTFTFNIAGCMEIEGNKPCAAADEAASGCESAACDDCFHCDGPPVCFVSQCYSIADVGTCKKYSEALKACANDDGGPISANCFAGTDFDSKYIAIAPLFCGP